MRFNLSEINELIRSRRTIYPEQFSDRKVHKEQIELLLNNAQWAPTHGNTQPWRFQVFMEDGRQKLSTFLGQTYMALTPTEQQDDAKLAKMLRRPLLASAVVAVSMKRQESEKIPEIEEIEDEPLSKARQFRKLKIDLVDELKEMKDQINKNNEDNS